MPLELKGSLSLQDPVVDAARRRAADEKDRDFGSKELDQRTKNVLSRRATMMSPPLVSDVPLSSYRFREFLKDSKYTIGIMAGQSNQLEQEINSTARTNFALLDDIQKDVRALESDITEEEVKILDGYSQVHYNAFVRPRDGGLDYRDKNWLVDYKTDLSFLPEHMVDTSSGAGATLPLLSDTRVPLKDVKLVGEGTDFGDTKRPILTTPARNLMFQDKTFRHIVIKKDFDGTSRKFFKGQAQCTFLLELPSVQLVNTLHVRPLGHSSVQVDSVSYLNEAGENVNLQTVTLNADRLLTLMFEPVRTRFLTVRFIQKGAVGRMAYELNDPRVQALNDSLSGAGFSQLLPEESEEIQGRVFDFSMEEIRLGAASVQLAWGLS